MDYTNNNNTYHPKAFMSYNFGSSSSSSSSSSTTSNLQAQGNLQAQVHDHYSNFEFSDTFLDFTEWLEEEEEPAGGQSQSPTDSVTEVISSTQQDTNLSTWDSGTGSREKKEMREKVAFKTKSEVEILDDGYKWRKYGKKMVKNSPNPRNYYRCSAEGCTVKKRIERDKEDPEYVITTYEGIHNHLFPSR